MSYGSSMHAAPNAVFKRLADPTRRAIIERLTRDGEKTVRAPTDHAGVSQPAVSRHLGVLIAEWLMQNDFPPIVADTANPME
jgi:DNA-binding transcriptional ArsR family regulator